MIQIQPIDKTNPQSAALARAKKSLDAGELVIVPTETVYGIACDPTVPGALDKLVAAKGRDSNKPIARLAANTEQVKQTASNWNAGLQALAATYWPGPLTLVLETATGWTGYRVPDHAVAIGLAEICGHTLALTSANLSGTPDTKTAQAALAAVPVNLALDSGPSADQAIPSTVIKVAGNQIECLREGALPFTEVNAVFLQNIEKGIL